MSSKALTLIILQYNGVSLTKNLLDSIVKYEKEYLPEYEIILADNGSTEGDGFGSFKADYPFVTLVKNEENYGFAKGVNRIAATVTTPYLLLINNDIILTEDSIHIVLKQMIAINADAMTCAMTDGENSIMQNWSCKLSSAGIVFYIYTGFEKIWRAYVRRKSTPSRVYYINGGFLMLRSAIFKKVGYFTERFFMYTEDLELMLKLNKIKARMYYTPATGIIHLDGKSAETVWTTAEKEELTLRQALEIYSEQSGKAIFAIHRFFWMLIEYLKYKRSKNMKHYYRYSFLAKNLSSKH